MTTEDLSEIRNRLASPLPLALDCHKLLEEVHRLRRSVAEARAIIEHVGYTSVDGSVTIAKANAWMKENP